MCVCVCLKIEYTTKWQVFLRTNRFYINFFFGFPTIFKAKWVVSPLGRHGGSSICRHAAGKSLGKTGPSGVIKHVIGKSHGKKYGRILGQSPINTYE